MPVVQVLVWTACTCVQDAHATHGPCIHVCMHTHTNMHAHAHVYMHAHAYEYMHAHSHSQPFMPLLLCQLKQALLLALPAVPSCTKWPSRCTDCCHHLMANTYLWSFCLKAVCVQCIVLSFLISFISLLCTCNHSFLGACNRSPVGY